jgi:hypothetical protein
VTEGHIVYHVLPVYVHSLLKRDDFANCAVALFLRGCADMCVSSHVGDGKCVVCDSYVRPCTLVRICDECNYGSYAGRCVICGGVGISDAYYCKECTVQEKDVSS